MWPIDCTKDTIKNRGSTVNIWRIKLSISSIFRSVKTSCLCKIPSAKKNIFLLQKFSVFSFSSYIFFFSEYFPPFPSPIFLLRSSSRYQNVKMSKFQCPHSISRTCLAQEFGLVPMYLASWPRPRSRGHMVSSKPHQGQVETLEGRRVWPAVGRGESWAGAKLERRTQKKSCWEREP